MARQQTGLRQGRKAPHGDEEERAQLYKILPAGISQDMLSHAHDQPTAFKLLEWMEEKSLFL